MFGNIRPGAQTYRQMGIDSDALVASPHQLIMMPFDGALRAIDTATVQLEAGDTEGKGRPIGKAIAIVGSGLSASLDLQRGGEIAGNLSALYAYVVQRLAEANIGNDRTLLAEAHRVLAHLRDSWIAIGHAGHHGSPCVNNDETRRDVPHSASLEVLALYREVERLTDNMVSAAHRADWDRLVELEAGCATCVKALQGCRVPEKLSTDVKRQKVDLLRRILANDREIRQLTEPWMQSLATYLDASDTRCQVIKAYGER